MRIFVAAIAFAVTIGGLFLFENYKTPLKEENYAQIVQGLVNQNKIKTPTPKPISKSDETAAKILAPSATPSFTSTPSASLPSPSPAPLSTSVPALTPVPTVNAPESTPTPTPTPVPQPAQQNEQITIISLTSPVKQNSTAQLDIKTPPQALCAIKVTLPSGSQSTAKGLEDKTADNSGIITWSWKINWNTTPGTANIDITCSKDGQSFSKSLQMIIIER